MTARKKYDDHGGVLTVQQALYHAAHDYGLPRLCGIYGWSQGDMRDRFSLTVMSKAPTLLNFIEVLEATRDPRILTAVCEPVAAVWTWADEVKDAPADLDVLVRGTKLMTAAAALIDEVVTALDNDGEIDRVEMGRVLQRMYELQQEAHATVQTARQFEVEA